MFGDVKCRFARRRYVRHEKIPSPFDAPLWFDRLTTNGLARATLPSRAGPLDSEAGAELRGCSNPLPSFPCKRESTLTPGMGASYLS